MPTLDSHIAQLKDQLLSALCQKADLETQVSKLGETIASVRNALTGVQLAQQVGEADTKAAASTP